MNANNFSELNLKQVMNLEQSRKKHSHIQHLQASRFHCTSQKIVKLLFANANNFSELNLKQVLNLEQSRKKHSHIRKLQGSKFRRTSHKFVNLLFHFANSFSRVEFEPNSELGIIGKDAFSNSIFSSIVITARATIIFEHAFTQCSKLSRITIEPNSEFQSLVRIQIPAKTIELKDKWHIGTDNLSHADAESGYNQYSSFDEKCVIGKSDKSTKDYDTLIFWARD